MNGRLCTMKMSSELLLIKLMFKVLPISKTNLAACEFGTSTLSKEHI
jgi:hypothetical protein